MNHFSRIQVLQGTYSGLQHSFHSLHPTTPHLVECVSALIGLLGNQNVSWPTITKTAMFLYGLGKETSIVVVPIVNSRVIEVYFVTVEPECLDQAIKLDLSTCPLILHSECDISTLFCYYY